MRRSTFSMPSFQTHLYAIYFNMARNIENASSSPPSSSSTIQTFSNASSLSTGRVFSGWESTSDISDQNVIYCDNQSAIALAHNPEHHARTKHIDIQYHFVRNCVEDGTTRLEYCPTEDMVADGLTKALGPERHRKLAKLMGMGVWQKYEDYAITETEEGMDVAEV